MQDMVRTEANESIIETSLISTETPVSVLERNIRIQRIWWSLFMKQISGFFFKLRRAEEAEGKLFLIWSPHVLLISMFHLVQNRSQQRVTNGLWFGGWSWDPTQAILSVIHQSPQILITAVYWISKNQKLLKPKTIWTDCACKLYCNACSNGGMNEIEDKTLKLC